MTACPWTHSRRLRLHLCFFLSPPSSLSSVKQLLMDEIQNKYVLYESKERSSKQKQIKFEIIDLDFYRGKVKIT